VWTIKLLGDLQITHDGVAVRPPGGVRLETFILIALSGPGGILADDLQHALRRNGRDITALNLQRRVSDLRAVGLPIPDVRASNRYRLDPDIECAVDALTFISGVEQLTEPPDTSEAERLMGLWRGNPMPGLRAPEPIRRRWRPLDEAVQRMVRALATLTPQQRTSLAALPAFAGLFPEDAALRRMSGYRPARPMLLVAEDQIMDELTRLLEDEYELLTVASYEEWKKVLEEGSLAHVQGALIDKHLDRDRPDDSIGTIKIADYLRRYTDIAAVLLTVDVGHSTNKLLDVCKKYRLLDVIRKDRDGDLNRAEIVEAARSTVDSSDRARAHRIERFAESVAYHVEEEFAFNAGAGDRLVRCEEDVDRVRKALRRGDLERAERELARLRQTWERRPAATY
jgi:hypothetical protein